MKGVIMVKKNVDKQRAKLKRNIWPINPVTKTIPNKKKYQKTGNRRSLNEDAFSSIIRRKYGESILPIPRKSQRSTI